MKASFPPHSVAPPASHPVQGSCQQLPLVQGGAAMCLESDPTCLLLFPSRPLRKGTLLTQPEQVVLGRRAKSSLQFSPVLEFLCTPTAPRACQHSSGVFLAQGLSSSSQSSPGRSLSNWLCAPPRFDGWICSLVQVEAETLSLLRSSGKDSFMARVLRAAEPALRSCSASGPILPAVLAPGLRSKCQL